MALGSPRDVIAAVAVAPGPDREAAPPPARPRDAAALDAGPLTFRDHFLSLYQSIAEDVARASAGATESAAAVPDADVILAAERVAQAYDAGVPVAPTAQTGTESLTAGELAGRCAALALRMLRARLSGDAATLARIMDEMEAGKCDPGWARTLEEYVKYFGPLGTRANPLYVTPAKAGEAALPIKSGARIGLIGDWGTGTVSARRLLGLVAAQKPDVLIHLGDIYYSGTPRECGDKFEAAMATAFGPKGQRIPIFTLAGNHDMYCGGIGYYGLIERVNAAPLVQPASFFCLRSEDGAWQLLAMDTGRNDYSPLGVEDVVTFVEPEEAEWLKRRLDEFGGRTVLLSHHQLFSAFSRIGEADAGSRTQAVNPSLFKMLESFGKASERIAAWFWGHEHNLCIYAPYRGLARGRCVGHGAVPVFIEDDPYEVLATVESPPTLLPDTRVSHDGSYYRHGFAMLTLNGDGTGEAEYFEDRDGTAMRTYAEVL
ncbi:MAG: metallophosphoesterase [Hyphomicrobiales bacterium]